MQISEMSLEQKIGQLFLVMINGPVLSSEYKEHFMSTKIGNYILFAKDLTDYKSIRTLTDSLQDLAKTTCGIPAFISVDQEGGMVTRVFSGATHFPSNMAITASGEASSMEQLGAMVGLELRALGININHAPVLDVNNNPNNPIIGVRAYSDDPHVVAKMGVSYMKGLQKSGVIASGKHFPGHGDTTLDSHLGLPSIEHSMERLKQVEFVPFSAAIRNGVDSFMTAHVSFKAIDNEVPATLSKKIIKGLLRQQLGFEGLIISDCMTMKAVKDAYTTEQSCVMALNAGIDLICLNAPPDIQSKCIQAVQAAAIDGKLPLEVIDAAVERILRYKQKYQVGHVTTQPQETYPTHEALADKLSKKSITVTQGKEMLPITGQKFYIISPPPVRTSIADDTVTTMDPFCKQAAKEFGNMYSEITIDPNQEEITSIINATKDYDTVLYACYSALVNSGQIQLYNALKAEGKKVILVSLRIPYDVMKMKDADCHIAAYEYTNRSVCNVINVLAGKTKPEGTLPIKLH